jgi:hypothetical protein
MPPALANRYNELTAPVALIAVAPATGTLPSVTSADLQASALIFVAECQQWATSPG